MNELEPFYDYLLIKKGFGDVTIDGYRRVLSKITRDIGSFIPTIEQIENHIAVMRKNGYSYSHLRNTIVIAECYMNFLGKPVKFARMRRPKPIIKDTLTEGEIARMIAATKNSREQVIVAILAYSGIRNKEFCSLKVKDVDFDNGTIKIFSGKGNKDRVAYISRECGKIISQYLRDYPREDDHFLITTLVRKNQYSGWDLRKMVKVVAKRAKIKKRVYPHLMRHSLAVNLLQHNMNIMSIQQVLGHQSLQSTLIYAHSIPQKVQNEYIFSCPNYI